MEARATAKYIRTGPRKARLVTDQIVGKSSSEAEDILRFTNKKASTIILGVLRSAVANAAQKGAKVDELEVSQAYVNDGPTLKRFRPRAMGRATRIRKRTSHITIVVAEPEVVTPPKKKEKTAAKRLRRTERSKKTEEKKEGRLVRSKSKDESKSKKEKPKKMATKNKEGSRTKKRNQKKGEKSGSEG